MSSKKWGIVAIILYLGRNFFKCLFWFLVFLIFYGLNALLN